MSSNCKQCQPRKRYHFVKNHTYSLGYQEELAWQLRYGKQKTVWTRKTICHRRSTYHLSCRLPNRIISLPKYGSMRSSERPGIHFNPEQFVLSVCIFLSLYLSWWWLNYGYCLCFFYYTYLAAQPLSKTTVAVIFWTSLVCGIRRKRLGTSKIISMMFFMINATIVALTISSHVSKYFNQMDGPYSRLGCPFNDILSNCPICR